MRSINRTYKVLCSLMLLAAVSGCSGFLDEENKSNFTQDSYFTSPEQAESAVIGIYNSLHTFQNSNGYGERPWVALELLTGHATTLGQSFFNRQFIEHTTDLSNPFFRTLWSNSYFAIANANLVLQEVPDITMDDARKSQLMGEASFLRAFFYYHLVRLFGDVPLITEPIDATSEQLYPSRDDQALVYDLIISDLLAAEQAGLPNVDMTGRVSLGAVKSLLASVYLTTAGHPLQRTENYQKAADKAEEVIDAGWYSLFTDYAFLRDNEHKNQGELIFQDQYEQGIATNSLCALIIPYFSGISKFHDEYGALVPTDEFYESYEAGDLRAEEQQFFFTEYPSISNPSDMVEFNRYALFKYFHEESALNTGSCDENWTLLRLPEVMLIYAEAANEVDGPTDKAQAQLADIRDRANLTTPDAATFTKETFREAVWRERYHELCFENKAYFDIQRTRKVYDVVNGAFVDAIGHVNESGIAFTEKYLLWGVPQSEIDNNAKLLPNNTAW